MVSCVHEKQTQRLQTVCDFVIVAIGASEKSLITLMINDDPVNRGILALSIRKD